ncbi:MAG: T9SS type A sorting domain-containing protein [Bacteroidota bacterium]
MKKLFTFLFASMIVTAASAQFTCDMETWSGTRPVGFTGVKTSLAIDSTAQYTTNVHGGTYACRIYSGTTSHKRLTTAAQTITTGQSYTITFWVRGHGEVRTGLWTSDPSGTTGYLYNSYIIVNSATWTQQTQTVTSDTNSSTAEFIFSFRNTLSDFDQLQIDDVSITTATTSNVSLYDIQYTTNPSGDSPLNNQVVNTHGVVVAKYGGGYFLQDGNGAWNGIYVYDAVNLPVVGDSVTLTALVTEYMGLTELKNVANFIIKNSGNTIQSPIVVTAAQSNTENFEGTLIKVLDVVACDTIGLDSYGYWNAKNGTDSVHMDNLFAFFTPTIGAHYNVTGLVYYTYSKFRIEPRNAADVELISGINESANSTFNLYPNPATDVLNIQSSKNIAQVIITDVQGKVVSTRLVNESNIQLNTTSFLPGLYLLQLINEDGTTGTRRFIVE